MEQGRLKKLIKGCIREDRASQKLLFEHYYGRMLGVCMRYTRDKDSAKDVVQLGFIKVFDKLNEFDFEGSFEGWVRRIMVNTSIDSIRKKDKSPTPTDNEFVLETNYLHETDNKTDDTAIKEKADLAMKAIQLLSPAYKTVFNLYVIENYSHKEIAQILNITEGSSKSNLFKAKQKLRKILEEKNIKLEI